jgi:hypothetical protein
VQEGRSGCSGGEGWLCWRGAGAGEDSLVCRISLLGVQGENWMYKRRELKMQEGYAGCAGGESWLCGRGVLGELESTAGCPVGESWMCMRRELDMQERRAGVQE